MSTLARTDPAEVPETDTLSERAAGLVERDIIAGVLAPGARLGIVDLVQRYDIGATPLREGLSRLVSRGLIVGIGQRGFRVADVSREDLLDITRMRTVVEMEALRLAIINGDDAWEAGIVGTLHQMRRHIERTGNDFREGAPDFDRLHKAFHTSLLAACGSRRLLSAHSELYDQAYRYRRVMMRGFDSGKKFVAAHQDLADQVLARDVGKAQAMLEAHLHSTLDFVYPPAKGNSKRNGKGNQS
jgi:DNA-binding GntR family transcriptional regulator